MQRSAWGPADVESCLQPITNSESTLLPHIPWRCFDFAFLTRKNEIAQENTKITNFHFMSAFSVSSDVHICSHLKKYGLGFHGPLIKTGLGCQIKHDPHLQFTIFLCDLFQSPFLFQDSQSRYLFLKLQSASTNWALLYPENLVAHLVLFARSVSQRSFSELTVLYLSCSSASMDFCFLIVVVVFTLSLSNGQRTLKFVSVVSIMYLSSLLPD